MNPHPFCPREFPSTDQRVITVLLWTSIPYLFNVINPCEHSNSSIVEDGQLFGEFLLGNVHRSRHCRHCVVFRSFLPSFVRPNSSHWRRLPLNETASLDNGHFFFTHWSLHWQQHQQKNNRTTTKLPSTTAQFFLHWKGQTMSGLQWPSSTRHVMVSITITVINH